MADNEVTQVAEAPAGGTGETSLADLIAALNGAAPGRLCKGHFSLYKTEDDGLMLAFRLDGDSEDRHLPVPAHVIRLAVMAAGGTGPMGMLGKLLGRG